ncbi:MULTISPECIES: VOC family protein [Clostridium]|uniref:VOC family protein n=1 Tax=Clostridium frigoriphilum TaxID=443253 RepID=A0ABU7UW07_9CLOT|nr:VOC family protein [Clostridium sp. DSM 17811]MBU3101961.1 VOC family protein [Clostridium sp. DSM 17811]
MIENISLGAIMIDCDDDKKLREFYAEFLGWERCEVYSIPGVRSGDGVVFYFVKNEDYIPPIWPEQANKQQKQIHFDFMVPNVSAVQHAETLGAVKTLSQFGGTHSTTILDPTGRPFCLHH